MKLFLWNVLLSVTWAAATAQFTIANLLFGFVLGYLVLSFANRMVGPTRYFTKVPLVIRFFFFYLWQLFLSNLRVAYGVITPLRNMSPAVIAVPLEARTDAEITLLANLITLTPGTLSLDLSPDRRLLFVHVMYLDQDDVKLTAQNIKNDLERRVLEVMR